MGVYTTLLAYAASVGPILLGSSLADLTGNAWLGLGTAITAWVFTATAAMRSLGDEKAKIREES